MALRPKLGQNKTLTIYRFVTRKFTWNGKISTGYIVKTKKEKIDLRSALRLVAMRHPFARG